MDRSTTPPPKPSRRRFLIACGGAAAIGAIALARRQPGGLKLAERTSAALGSKVTITALHRDVAVADRAVTAALAEIARIEHVMSLYQSDSQLCALNRDGRLMNPDPSLVEVLEAAADMAVRSGGAFDPTVQPLWTLYASSSIPSEEALAAAVKLVDWRNVHISANEIRFQQPGMAITLNGIAQGYATDRAMTVLRRHGIEQALVDAGEIASLGDKFVGRPWNVGIQHPRVKDAYIGVAELNGRCMSTSGDYETAFTADLSKNHIVDPATGRSPDTFASVTVIAPTATQADALSTAIFVLGPERGIALANASPGTDVLFVMKDGRTFSTAGFPLQSQEADHAA
jgi:thiamine biosynthesis lipoprotein